MPEAVHDVAAVMAGGYARSVEDIEDTHFANVRAASRRVADREVA